MVVSGDVQLIGKALLAGALGFVVGWEREAHGHGAGTRTLALVTLAAAVFTALAIQTFPVGAASVVQGTIQGIGFLGAGIVLRAQAGSVRGLTTAAAIWAMTSIGIVSGAGHYVSAIGLTAIVLVLLWWSHIPLLKRLQPKRTREAPRRGAAADRPATPPEARA